MKEVEAFLQEKLNDQSIVVVAISGGPDSMVLLHLLLSFAKTHPIKIVCVHVNHNVRKASYKEAKKIESYCFKNNIIFEKMVIEDYSNDNFQSEARTKRFKFFQGICEKYKAKYLLTAHHGDDLIETILMRINRGSYLTGYAGFTKEKEIEKVTLLKPLITLTKEQILTFAKSKKLWYAIDKSNKNVKYTRNRFRKYILPFLKKENPDVHLKYLKFSQLLTEVNKYIDEETKNQIKKIYKFNKIDIKKILNQKEIIQHRIIELILEEIYHEKLHLINDQHFIQIKQMLISKKPNLMINLPDDIIVKKEYDFLFINKNVVEFKQYNIKIKKETILPNGKTIKKINESKDDNNYICRLDSKEIKLPLSVRNRQEGDKIIVKGLNGSKKIKDILIDSKIPLEKRNDWPVLVDASNEVLWLPGLKKSNYNKSIKEKYDIIFKYEEEGEKANEKNS